MSNQLYLLEIWPGECCREDEEENTGEHVILIAKTMEEMSFRFLEHVYKYDCGEPKLIHTALEMQRGNQYIKPDGWIVSRSEWSTIDAPLTEEELVLARKKYPTLDDNIT